MLASFLLSVREGLEAALIIGIVLAALRKMGRAHLSAAVWQGVLAAACISILAGVGLVWMGGSFEGRSEQIFEGVAMFVAAFFLTWMIFWMRRQSVNLQKNLEADVAVASSRQGSRSALFWLAFLSVGRELFELVLFLTAVQIAGDAIHTNLGAILGLATAFVLGWGLFTSSKRMNLRLFFNVTNVMLAVFAAGLLAHGVHEFNEAGIIPSVIEHVWNINPILDENQPLGQMLTALFGYNGNPSLTEILAYGLYFFGFWIFWKKPALPTTVQEQTA